MPDYDSSVSRMLQDLNDVEFHSDEARKIVENIVMLSKATPEPVQPEPERPKWYVRLGDAAVDNLGAIITGVVSIGTVAYIVKSEKDHNFIYREPNHR